jgi:quercetin dioxygenase-like cupin family protein
MKKPLIVVAAIVLVAVANSIAAQQSAAPTGIKRTMLQKVEVPGTSYEAITAIAEVPPNTTAGRHTHPGPETGYVVEGAMTLLIEGQPPMALKAGDSYQVRRARYTT